MPITSKLGGHDAPVTKTVDEALHKHVRPPTLGWSQSCVLCSEKPTRSFPFACQHIYSTGGPNHMLVPATDGKNIHIWCIGDEGRLPREVLLPLRLTRTFENSFRVYLERHPDEYRSCPTPDYVQFSPPHHRGSACGLPTKPWTASRSLLTLDVTYDRTLGGF